MSFGREAGTLPASTRTEPAGTPESFLASVSSASRGISGPLALISVSSFPLILTLTRDCPGMRIKSVSMPRASSLRQMISPTSPATKPVATDGTPKFCSTAETLMPLPPGAKEALSARCSLPGASCPTRST